MIQVILLFFIIVGPLEGGAFTTRLAPECRAFSGALKIEKLKAPLISGPEGAVDTNEWCIKIMLNCVNCVTQTCVVNALFLCA